MRSSFLCGMLLLVLVISACRTVQGPGDPGGTVGNFAVDDHPIQWERSPSNVVFRAEVAGGTTADEFLIRREVPACTIYGDNRIVWVNELGEAEREVRWDILTDAEIRAFVEFLVVEQEFYIYENTGEYLAVQPPTPLPPEFIRTPTPERVLNLQSQVDNPNGYEMQPFLFTDTPEPTPIPTVIPYDPDNKPFVEELTLNINNEAVLIDAFTAWPPGYYDLILATCITLSETPVLYQPAAGWVTVREREYDATRPFGVLPSESIPIDLAAVGEADEAVWFEGDFMASLWNTLLQDNPQTHYLFGEAQYQIVLEVPNVTRTGAQPPAEFTPTALLPDGQSPTAVPQS